MNLISARNAHEALPIALQRLFQIGIKRQSRNGPVLQMPGPTLICYEQPLERVVFWPERNANPFFHVMEAMWMLAGRRDVEFVQQYSSRIKDYSDDGEIFNGAYGYRWRNEFGLLQRADQLEVIARNLRGNPDCRRQVLSMWNPNIDLVNQKTKDLPCNTHAYFTRDADGRLDMTVCNRSNDLVWGCLGANAVHFSFLLEYMAANIGCGVGKYYQFTNNLHGYLETVEPLREVAGRQGEGSPYESGFGIWPLASGQFEVSDLDNDLFKLGRGDYSTKFFTGVVHPMERAWSAYKAHGPEAGLLLCESIAANDWRRAASEWMQRCAARRRKAQDDGVAYE